MRKVEQKLCDAALYIHKNPQIVKSIMSFPYITAAL